jgi:hypothetical protein
MSKQLVLWGRHASHDNVWLKLCGYSRRASQARQREGWMVAILAKGERP